MKKKNREKRKDKQAKIHVGSNYFPRKKLHLISCQGIEFFLCTCRKRADNSNKKLLSQKDLSAIFGNTKTGKH